MNRIFIFIFLGLVGFCKLNAQTEFNRQQQTNFSENYELRESEPVMNIQEYNPEITSQSNQLKSSTASPAATYKHPSGYLRLGYSRKNTLLNANNKLANVYIGNAYIATQWKSTKNTDTKSVDWDFKNGVTSTLDNPTVTFPYKIYDNPILSAINGNQVVPFQQGEAGAYNKYKLGGDSKWQIGSELVEFGLGNYDPSIDLNFASDMIPGDKGTPGLIGIGNRFDKPVAPFLIRGVYVFCINIVPKDNEPVRLNIYTMNANGTKGTLLATSTAERSSYINILENGGNYLYMIPFSFNEYVEIKDSYFIEFVNYKSGGTLFQKTSHPDGTNYAYTVFDNKIVPVPDKYTDQVTGGRLNTSFCINLEAVFPFLYCETPTNRILPSGGTYDFAIKTYWVPGDWTLESPLPDWIKIGTYYTTDPATNTVNLPIEVSALPDNVPSRKFDIKYKSYGCNITLTVDQSRNYVGIESTQENQVKAFSQSGSFRLEYPADVYQMVSIYNVAGQQINEYKLDATGSYMIPTSNLSKGMYILKFGGTASQSMKIVKE